MLMCFVSKLVSLVFGLLYPAYASYLVVKTKDVRGYVQWMMYWIVFAFYSFCESFTDTILGPWFPLYYEGKIVLVLWLMAPATAGANTIYRRFLHPKLVQYEPEIEICIDNFKKQISSFMFTWAGRAATVIADTFTNILAETIRNTTRVRGSGGGGGRLAIGGRGEGEEEEIVPL